MSTLLKAIKAPLPEDTADGSPVVAEQKTGVFNAVKNIVADLSKLGIDSASKVAEMSLKIQNGEYIDDKDYLMEYIIQVNKPCTN